MKIAGFQPFSLLDYPGKACSIVFTQGCPFRCPYCHNPELIPTQTPATVEEDDVVRYLLDHRHMLDAVCVTGGEPTIQVGLVDFLRRLKALGFLVKLDTNGVNPTLVKSFIEEGLVDYFAMDLKHRWEKYEEVVRSGGAKTVEKCRETFRLIQDSGIAHEFRTTVFPGNHTLEDFRIMVGYLKPGETYYLQSTAFQKTLEPLSADTVLDAADCVRDLRQQFPDRHIYSR